MIPKFNISKYLMLPNWQVALVAVLLSVSLWYAVVGREKVESWLEVPLEIKGLPGGYILSSSPPESIRVRIRGPEGLMRSLDRKNLQYTMDLSKVSKGDNVITLLPENMPFSGAFDVLEIAPPVLEFFVDALSSGKSLVTPVLRDALPRGLRLAEIQAIPHSVLLSGPESIVSQLTSVNATVAMPPDIATKDLQTQARIITPPGVQAQPAEVIVNLTIKGSRKVLNVQTPIKIKGTLPENSSIDPEVVRVQLDVPLAWTIDGKELRGLSAVIEVNEKMNESRNLPVRISIPEGGKVISITPAKATLTIL